MADEQKPKETKPPFRFLTHSEFAALTQEERVKYLDQAVRELKAGALPSDLFRKD